MDHFLFKVNVTWTSPFFVYTPLNQWYNGVTSQNDSVASFNFRANGVKLFGSTNATYTTQVDDMASQPANPRSFNYTSGEIPSNLLCKNDTPWGCTVIAEYNNTDPAVDHTFRLQSQFNASNSGDNVNILGMQVIYDTGLTVDTLQQLNEVAMEDDRLVYAGKWQNITYDPSDYRISRDPGSTITFPFSGYAIYVWGATDLYTSRLSVSLDGQAHDMPAPSSGWQDPNCLLWFQAGLDQTKRHTVVVTNPDTTGLVIRGFTVVRLVDPHNPGESVPPTSQPNRLSAGAIAGIVVGVVLVLLLAVAAFFVYRRIRRRRVQFEKDLSIPSAQPLTGTSTSNSSRFGHVTPWEGPNPSIHGPSSSFNGLLQTPQSSVPHIPIHPPPRIDEAMSPNSASTSKSAMAFGTSSPIAGPSRVGPSVRQYGSTSTQTPMSPGFNSPGAGAYAMEQRKPPLDLGGPSSTPQTERGVAAFITPPSSSGQGYSDSERARGSEEASRRAMLDSEMVQADTMGAQEHPDRSATPPPAYEYRVQPGPSSSALDDEEEDRRRRRDEERRRRRDEKTASGSGLGVINRTNEP